MTAKKTPTPLQNFVDAAVDDLLNMSDDEVLAELLERGGDPDAVAADMRDLAKQVVVERGRTRLAQARSNVAARRRSPGGLRATHLPTARKLQIVAQFSAGDPHLRGRLTMAARSGEGASESEVDSVLEDLIDLGLIDEAGNLL